MASRVILPRPQQILLPANVPILPEYPGNMTYQLSGDLTQDPNVAEKNHRKVLRNRVNAQLSREKKRKYVEDLEDRVKVLEVKNKHLERKVVQLEATNATLQAMLDQQPTSASASASASSDFAPAEFDFLAGLSGEESVMEVLLSSSSSSSSSSDSTSSPTLTSTPEEIELPEFFSDDESSSAPASLLSTASTDVPSVSAVAPLNDPAFWNPQILSDDSSMESDGSSGLHSRSNSNSDIDSLDYFLSGSEDEHFSPPLQQQERASPQSPLALLQQPSGPHQAFADEGGMAVDDGIAALSPPPGLQQQYQQPLQPSQLQQVGELLQPQSIDNNTGGGAFSLQQSQQLSQGDPLMSPPGDQQVQSSLGGIPGQLQDRLLGDQPPQVPLQQPQHLRALANPLMNSLENLAGLTEQLASTTPSLLQLAEAGGTRDDTVQRSDGQDFQVPQAPADPEGRDLLVQTTQQLVERVQSLTEVSQHLIHTPFHSAFGDEARADFQPPTAVAEENSAPTMAQVLQASGPLGADIYLSPGGLDADGRDVPVTVQASIQRTERALMNLRSLGGGSDGQLPSLGVTQAGHQKNLQSLMIKSQNQDQNPGGFGFESWLISSAAPYFYQYVEDAEELQMNQPLPLAKSSRPDAHPLKKKQIQRLALSFHDQLSSLLQFVLQLAQTVGWSNLQPSQPLQATPVLGSESQRFLFSPIGFSPSSPSLLVF